MKILIADDDITTRCMLEAILPLWGYEVVVACDGEEAWQILQTDDAPRLAVLDWVMPGMNGVEVCKRVREELTGDEHYTYIILLTIRGSKEEVVAGLEMGADDYIVKPFDPHELRVRVQIGQRIVALNSELVAAKEALRIQATHDPLTGIFNRRAIIERLQTEMSRAGREGKLVGTILIDIDHFKSVNDNHGHLTGDAVLRECVERIGSVLRKYDSLGRFGGEEFLVVAPVGHASDLESIAERIRLSIGTREMDILGVHINVTASLGIAVTGGITSLDAFINAADTALYQVKNTGRNCVKWATC